LLMRMSMVLVLNAFNVPATRVAPKSGEDASALIAIA
jgi:hypothetical protein